MSTDIKVSIIVPVYKVPLEYLRECFNSLLAQTMQECEFVVVSDGAPDAECSVCEEFTKKDSRFKFYKREHAGVSATRNYGIEQAQGEYITFVDSDDWIEVTCCEELYAFAKQHSSDVVLFDYIPEGMPYKRCFYGNESKDALSQTELDEIQKQCICLTNDKYVGAVSTICKFTKKKMFKEKDILFANNIKRSEDRPVSYKIFESSHKTSYLKKFFYHYRAVSTSITHTMQNTLLPTWLPYLVEIKKISLKHRKLIGNQALSAFFCSLGEEYFCKSNTTLLYHKIKELSKFIKSKDFQWVIQDATFTKQQCTPLIIKFDEFFIRHKLALPIWLHAIKWKLFGRK